MSLFRKLPLLLVFLTGALSFADDAVTAQQQALAQQYKQRAADRNEIENLKNRQLRTALEAFTKQVNDLNLAALLDKMQIMHKFKKSVQPAFESARPVDESGSLLRSNEDRDFGGSVNEFYLTSDPDGAICKINFAIADSDTWGTKTRLAVLKGRCADDKDVKTDAFSYQSRSYVIGDRHDFEIIKAQDLPIQVFIFEK